MEEVRGSSPLSSTIEPLVRPPFVIVVEAFWLVGLGNLGIGLYLLITLGFLDGTPGPNQYGPSPKGYGGYSRDLAEEFS